MSQQFITALIVISGFHRALLQSITFISRQNALDYTKLRSQNLRCIKIFKRHKIKDRSDMFRIVRDPSSGSIKLYLTEIRSGSLMFVLCLVGVWQLNFEPVVCIVHTHHWFKNYAAKHRLSTRQTSVNHYEFQSSTALYSLMMDRIRSETCRSDL